MKRMLYLYTKKYAALQMYLYMAAVYCACDCGIVSVIGSAEAKRHKKFKVICLYLILMLSEKCKYFVR
jgi:hypothetical protein